MEVLTFEELTRKANMLLETGKLKQDEHERLMQGATFVYANCGVSPNMLAGIALALSDIENGK